MIEFILMMINMLQVNPALLYNHVMFVMLYLAGFFLERKPCTICSLVFIVAMILICYSGNDSCILWSSCSQEDSDYPCKQEVPWFSSLLFWQGPTFLWRHILNTSIVRRKSSWVKTTLFGFSCLQYLLRFILVSLFFTS